MQRVASTLWLPVVFLALSSFPAAEEQGWVQHPLKFAAPKGDLGYTTLHCEEFAQVCHERSDYYIPLPYKKKIGIMAAADEHCTYLQIDCNNDYKMDTKITGKGGYATVKLLYDDDTVSQYAMKLIKGDAKMGGKWHFQRNCTMSGKVEGAQFTLVDDNNNGRYDDYGQDCYAVGETTYGTPLSKIVNIKGKLFEFESDPTGLNIRLRPFAGKTGCIDMASGYSCSGKLLVAVVQSGQNYFDVSGKDPLLVPCGEYKLIWGMIANGSQSAVIDTGKMQTFEVKEGETTKIAWGMPVRLEVDFKLSAGSLVIGMANVKAFGAANEEYKKFKPRPLQPQIEILNKSGGTIGRGAVTEPTDGC